MIDMRMGAAFGGRKPSLNQSFMIQEMTNFVKRFRVFGS